MDRKVVVAGAALLALVPASCGSSKPLTREAFAQKANAICIKRRAVISAVAARSHGNIRDAVRVALPTLESTVEQLSALKPPDELKSTYTQILTVERRNVTIAREALVGRFPRSEEVGAPLHHNEELRVQLGMPACN